jgi:hypothetical protein
VDRTRTSMSFEAPGREGVPFASCRDQRLACVVLDSGAMIGSSHFQGSPFSVRVLGFGSEVQSSVGVVRHRGCLERFVELSRFEPEHELRSENPEA